MSLSKLFTTSSVGMSDDGQPETAVFATIGDLPPEIRTLLLEYLLDGDTTKMLSYRLVSSQWKTILDSLLEKKFVSGCFRPFPRILMVKLSLVKGVQQGGQLYATSPPTILSGGTGHLPLNTLRVVGTFSNRNPDYFHGIPMDLPELMASFGRTLTNLALDNVAVGLDLLVNVLGFTHSLKCLSLLNVELLGGLDKFVNDEVPTAPPLPSLIALEVKVVNAFAWFTKQNFEIPYLWLVASYADHLVRLDIGTEKAFPALRKQHQYFCTNSTGARILVASTSEAGFGKLKELKISRPSAEFLRFSETPSLQNFSVIGLARRSHASLDDLTKFIGGCSGTLQKLFVDAYREDWTDKGEGNTGLKLERAKPKVIGQKLKTIKTRYPTDDIHKTILYESFFPKFPGFEVLQLIWFGTESDEIMLDPRYDEEVDLELGSDEEKEREDLKQRLASLRQQETALQGELDAALVRELEAMQKWRIARQRNGVRFRQPLGAPETRLHFQRKEEQAAIKQNIAVLRQGRVPLLKQLYVLNRKAKITREFLEGGIWSSCPKLRIVSVSSRGKPTGDICVLTRPSCGLQ